MQLVLSLYINLLRPKCFKLHLQNRIGKILVFLQLIDNARSFTLTVIETYRFRFGEASFLRFTDIIGNVGMKLEACVMLYNSHNI